MSTAGKNGTISLLALDSGGQAFANGSTFLDASADGTKAFFYAWENAGLRHGRDLRSAPRAATTRLSPPGIDSQLWTDWVGASDDGSKAYFDSWRPLTADDDDGDKIDLFRYEGGTLTLISADPSPVDPADAEDAFAAPEPLDAAIRSRRTEAASTSRSIAIHEPGRYGLRAHRLLRALRHRQPAGHGRGRRPDDRTRPLRVRHGDADIRPGAGEPRRRARVPDRPGGVRALLIDLHTGAQ